MKRLILILLALSLLGAAFPASAYSAGTLRNGMEGEEVMRMQQALIDLGFLKGTADGKFGTNTENAVRRFQKKHKLVSDGLAGAKTLELLYSLASGQSATQSTENASAAVKGTSSTPQQNEAIGTAVTSHATSFFNNDYTTLRPGMSGERVRLLQRALIDLDYLKGSADGVYGANTQAAVILFQKANKLTADGLAGKKTLTALETAFENHTVRPGGTETTETTTPAAPQKTATAPDRSSLRLLHWFNDVKPRLSNGQILTIVDPSTGISWQLKILSRGRHCDAEPATKADTDAMISAFGNTNTWNQKAVYVKLPDGTWTIGSTHDMPHMSGNIRDNGFDGHLCVHFLRDMDECRKNDPKYGVSNQNTIRAFWKSLTGETVP